MGFLNRNNDLRMSGKNGECKIAFIEPPNDNKIYYALLINDAVYRAWDIDSFNDEAIEFIEVLMEAFDKGYTIRAQSPTNIDNERKMIPMPMTISESLKNRTSDYPPVKLSDSGFFGPSPSATTAEYEENSQTTSPAYAQPVMPTYPAPAPTMPEIKPMQYDTTAETVANTLAETPTNNTKTFPVLIGITPLSPMPSATPQTVEPVQKPVETVAVSAPAPQPVPTPAPAPVSAPAPHPVMKVEDKPYGVCRNGHVTYRKIAFCPECGTKITEQTYSDIPMVEDDQSSNDDMNNLMASYMSNFNR